MDGILQPDSETHINANEISIEKTSAVEICLFDHFQRVYSQAHAFHYLQSGLKGTLNGNQIEFKAIESSFAVSISMQVMVFEAQNELENK